MTTTLMSRYIAGAALVAMLLAGCAGLVEVGSRAISLQDVVDMTAAGVGGEVIIRQIEATHSKFKLTPQQIIQLKKSGVGDDVLEAMIESAAVPDHFDWEYGYNDSAYPYMYPYDTYINGFPNSWYPVNTHIPFSYGLGYPYTVYRQRDVFGRFYKYGPPPVWDYRERRWRTPFDSNTSDDGDE